MSTLDSLDKLLEEELKDLYDAEKQLTRALPKLAKKASSPELREAIEEHLRQTEQHIERIEQAFEQLEMPARGKKCKGMQNLIKEGEEMIGETEEGPARDAVMIAGAQKVEHYEIASYGTARTWASLLGNEEVAALLDETLEEEKAADQKLTSIAESQVNEAAADEDEEEADEPRASRMPGARSNAARGTTVGRGPRQQAADPGRAGGRSAKRPRSR
jgi:ferritin-like metal-binding protein YciE